MAKIPGTNLTAPIVPFSDKDKFSTHFAKYGQGGYRSVPTIIDRNGIPPDRRELHMTVGVIENGVIYKLITDTNGNTTLDSDWKNINDIDILDINSNNIPLWQSFQYKSSNLLNSTISLHTSNGYGKILWYLEITDILPNLTFGNTILWRYDNDLELSLNSVNVFEFETWNNGVTWVGKVSKYSISTPEQYIDKEYIDEEINQSIIWQTLK